MPLAALAIVSGCAPGTSPPETLNPGSFSADLSDNIGSLPPFICTNATAKSVTLGNGDKVYQVHANDPKNDLTITIPIRTSVPYNISTQDADVDFVYYDGSGSPPVNQTFEANAAQGSCFVTISSLSSTQIQGTFSATSICSTIADTIHFTDGEFNATFE